MEGQKADVRSQGSGCESDARATDLFESDLWAWWRRRCWRGIENLHYFLQNLHNRRFVHVQSGGELFLECSEFLRKLTRTEQRFAHLDEGADDEHAHLNGARAAKHI